MNNIDNSTLLLWIAGLFLLFLSVAGCSIQHTSTKTSITGDNNCVTVQGSDRVLTDQDIKDKEVTDD